MSATVESRRPRFLLMGLVGAFTVVLVRTAWISDDAYITFRTVENFLDGYGLRWNVAERVQSYTHPLWMMLIVLAHKVTGESYFATLALSGLFTLAAVAAVVAVADSVVAATLGLTFLLASKAFVDYSTSGLENPLTHALLALFLWLSWKRSDRPGLLALVVSLILLNRMDCVLLVAPAIAVAFVRNRSWDWCARFTIGLTPFIAWELFSLVYYGALVPNTALAKLASVGIGRRDLAWQAGLYFRDSLFRDPITLCTIGGVALWTARTRFRDWPIAAGLLLYLIYIVRIGGDFMTGRFLAAPFFVAILVFVHRGVPRWMSMRMAVAVAAVVLITMAPRTNFSGSTFGDGGRLSYIEPSGISDERAFYYQWTGLLPVLHGARVSETAWALEGRSLASTGPRVAASRSVGLVGYYAGPTVHIVDVYALCDPLLSRLPSTDAWRIGHFERRLPDGYLETLSTGRAAIRDPGLAALYQKIVAVTRAPLLSRARLNAVIDLNGGGSDRLIVAWKSAARTPDPRQLFGSVR